MDNSQVQVKELQSIDSNIHHVPMTTQEDLKINYLESSNRLQEQVIASDSTKSLMESVKSDLNKGKKLYNQNIAEVLNTQLSTDEKARTAALEITSSDIKNDSNKLKEKFDQTSSSTLIRTAGQIADNIQISDEAIKKRNITLPLKNNKDNKN
ncbi:hypothetical protein REIS_1509 [Rickettsia endosymbiont of Ixodes scapularis]|nr:hypothetical protein REIS_1509 [Rickettsia endosymbiont of Ixodes scapularis]